MLDAKLLDDYYECAKLILGGDKGQPDKGDGHKGLPPMPAGPNGETVYDRIMPHPGDGGAGAPRPAGNYYVQRFGSARIVFNLGNL